MARSIDTGFIADQCDRFESVRYTVAREVDVDRSSVRPNSAGELPDPARRPVRCERGGRASGASA